MKLTVAAVGTRMPAWVSTGWQEYARRMPADCTLELKEIKPEARTSGKTAAQMLQAEAQRLRSAISPAAAVVALDERGRDLTTMDVFQSLQRWRAEGQDVVFLIGGPDGLDDELKRGANMRWRLSSMTLPHPLVRVILAEQLYRAWAIMSNHPYHRA